MSVETGRRQVVQAGATAAVAAPLLRSSPVAATFAKVPLVDDFASPAVTALAEQLAGAECRVHRGLVRGVALPSDVMRSLAGQWRTPFQR